MKKSILIFLAFFFFVFGNAQLLTPQKEFSKIDSLRGYLFPARASFNARSYKLFVNFEIEKKCINGHTTMDFEALIPLDSIQIDLDHTLKVDSIFFENKKLDFKRLSTHFYVYFPRKLKKFEKSSIDIYYSGSPKIAKNAPWDGGFVWKNDKKGRTWAGVACEGDGASIWWPCKDHWSDEPENGVEMHFTVPKPLVAVGNGNLRNVDSTSISDKITYTWTVTNPINLYNINFTIGNFKSFSGLHLSKNLYKEGKQQGDSLLLNFYVLDYNLEIAKSHFSVVPTMLDCYENIIGSFPFVADGYKLVETPYLGMEHQCAVAYGNQYKLGYLGNTDYTAGHYFDYIIIHETAHEWFGNNITASDPADMWIHEAYTTYMEGMYVECQKGYEAALDYVNHHKSKVGNQSPIRGIYGVAKEGDGDMYHKGALILNTLRHQFPNDIEWKKSLKSINENFYHKTIHYQDVVDFYTKHLNKDYSSFFNQYVSNSFIPELEIFENKKDKTLELKWKECVDKFNLIIPIEIDDKEYKIDLNSIEIKKLNYKKSWNIDDRKVYIHIVQKSNESK